MTIDIDALREQVGKLDCGDNSCMFGGAGKGRNSGMGTNGGCVCHEQLRNGRLLRALLPLCDEVERLQVESKSLGAEVRALKRENDEQQYHLGEFGMERGGLFTERDELKAELDGIMRDYQIESDENVRDIVERTTAAAVRLRDEKTALKAEVERLRGIVERQAELLNKDGDALARVQQLEQHIDTAGDGTNLVALLDLYHERKCAAEKRVRELEGEPKSWQDDGDYLALYVAPFDPVFGAEARHADEPHRVATAADIRKALEGGE